MSELIEGWDAITKACELVYPNQKNPKHYGTLISWELGGDDPLDGISVYDGGDYWHFVTYGLTELNEKKFEDEEISGYGMEFTLKLKKDSNLNQEKEILNICGILQKIAKISFLNGEIFNNYEYLYTGQKIGMDFNKTSNITGFITIPDNDIKTTFSKNGKIEFVEFIGVTDAELNAIINKEYQVEDIYKMLGNDLTDYNRKSLV